MRRGASPMTTPKGYKCPKCGKANVFPAWYMAHYDEPVYHRCSCGARNHLEHGECIGTEEIESNARQS